MAPEIQAALGIGTFLIAWLGYQLLKQTVN
jgi:hypothetical protein